ncbi:MAG: GTP-binding protein [Leptolyngbyaceae cyanobacterium bins.59]|nr:GTP-binding protein [Leptolyngbyaceae cyanobacterium bins.59]
MVSSQASLHIPKRGMPVTIITGFLGSGKTTLLNQILKNRQDLKVAVLVNEFGDIDIDSQLLMSIDEDMVQLSNGCICCTINENLVDAVYKVLEREESIDYLVIETTGIADPLPIMLTFLGTELRDLTRLDSILTLVDVETFTPDHFDSDAALNQIVYGDILLLNKTDLAPVEQVAQLEQYIHSLKQGARLIRCQRGEVPLPLILDVGYNDPGHYADLLNQSETKHTHHHHEHHHEHHEHHHHHSKHLENDGFISVSFVSDRPFSLTKFQNFLDQLPANVFRGKGILWFQESQMKHIFQLSGKRCSLEVESWTTPPNNQIVLIGRNLNPEQLRQELAQCQEFEPTKLSFR